MTDLSAGLPPAVPDPSDPSPVPASDDGARPPRAPRTRGVIAWILVVVVSVLVPLSVIAVWSVRTLTNTDRYVATMSPLVREPVVTDYIALAATNKLFDEIQVEHRIKELLPKRASVIAAPVTAELHTFAQAQASRLLASHWFAEFWDGANRRIHENLIKFLKGEPMPRVQQAQHIAISLTPVVDKVITELDQRGVTVFDPLKEKLAKGKQADFSLANTQQVKKIRSLFKVVSAVGWGLSLATLLLLLVAVAVAVERRKTILRAALGASIALVVVLAGLAIGRNVFINQAPKAPPDVTASVFDTVTRYLQHSLKVVLLVSLLLALLMWLVGPGRVPVWLRRTVWRGLCWIGRAVASVFNPERRGQVTSRGRTVAAWCLEHRSPLRLAGVGVAALIIVFSAALAVSSVWITLLVLVIYLLLLELVFLWARRTAVSAGPGGTGGTPGPPPSAAPRPTSAVGAGPGTDEGPGGGGPSGTAVPR